MAGAPGASRLVRRCWTTPTSWSSTGRLLAAYDAYRANGKDNWFARHHGDELDGPVAYFCAEFGLHESLGIYSGGLGVLAGDHCKAASDMALPFVAVGLFYRHGYFRQTIDADGHQEHAYPDLDVSRLPLQRVADEDGDPLTVPVELPGRTVHVAVWLVQVGRVPLLLLDTDTPLNDEAGPAHHATSCTCAAARCGSTRSWCWASAASARLRALGIEPAAWHLNEGHSAFLLVERARELVAAGVPLEEALAQVRSRLRVHHPHARSRRATSGSTRTWCGRVAGPCWTPPAVDIERILELGRGADGDAGQFDMTALLAAPVARAPTPSASSMRRPPTRTWHEIVTGSPILGITNGVHPGTWLGGPIRGAVLGTAAPTSTASTTSAPEDRFWERLPRISDEQLWDAHMEQKLELALFARGRLRGQLARATARRPRSCAEVERCSTHRS